MDYTLNIMADGNFDPDQSDNIEYFYTYGLSNWRTSRKPLCFNHKISTSLGRAACRGDYFLLLSSPAFQTYANDAPTWMSTWGISIKKWASCWRTCCPRWRRRRDRM